jgi:hypothetical protein
MKPGTSKGRTALRWTFLLLIFLVLHAYEENGVRKFVQFYYVTSKRS